jgi:hypothetical protein
MTLLFLNSVELATSFLSTDGGPKTVAQEVAWIPIYACLCRGIPCILWMSLFLFSPESRERGKHYLTWFLWNRSKIEGSWVTISPRAEKAQSPLSCSIFIPRRRISTA